MNDKNIAIIDLIFNFFLSYWYWLFLILFVCSIPAYIAISSSSAPWGSYTIAIGSALGLVISLYENRKNLLEEREINKENIIENLTRPKKEEAIFTVKQNIGNILLSNDSDDNIISLPNIFYEELKKEDIYLNSIFNSNSRSRFFSYFKKISRNEAMIFYYLNNKTQEKIHLYIKKYDEVIFDIRDVIYDCKVPIDKIIDKNNKTKCLKDSETLDIENLSNDHRKGSKLIYITHHNKNYQGYKFYLRWNFISKEFHHEIRNSGKSELTDVAANIHQNIVDELNQILKDIILEIENEYKKFGYPE